jgi:hypothetical protein
VPTNVVGVAPLADQVTVAAKWMVGGVAGLHGHAAPPVLPQHPISLTGASQVAFDRSVEGATVTCTGSSFSNDQLPFELT